jgi:hypothetical protein
MLITRSSITIDKHGAIPVGFLLYLCHDALHGTDAHCAFIFCSKSVPVATARHNRKYSTHKPFCVLSNLVIAYASHRHLSWAPGVFNTCFYDYNHARRLRLEKLL